MRCLTVQEIQGNAGIDAGLFGEGQRFGHYFHGPEDQRISIKLESWGCR